MGGKIKCIHFSIVNFLYDRNVSGYVKYFSEPSNFILMEYTINEKVQIIKWFYGGHTLSSIVNIWRTTFINRPVPCLNTIHRIKENFEKYGCVSPSLHKKPAHDNADRDIMICATVEENEYQTLGQISESVDVSRETVRKVLKKNKYRSYHVQKVNEIFPGDHYNRVQFCLDIIEKCGVDENFISNILFTDESSFILHGRHNPMLIRYWSKDNKHKSYTAHTQYPQKLNVWIGMLGDNIIGPFFINGVLNSQKYLQLLQYDIIPFIQNIPNIEIGSIWYQQDGCPAHNSAIVRQFLRNTFGNRIISLGGTIEWPARSPDLSPNDFFLWGYLKSKIYGFEHQRSNNLDELRQKIRNFLASITPDMLANVRRGFYDRVAYCLEIQGARFEHVIN